MWGETSNSWLRRGRKLAAVAHVHAELCGCRERTHRRHEMRQVERCQPRHRGAQWQAHSRHRPKRWRNSSGELLVLLPPGAADGLERRLVDGNQKLELDPLGLGTKSIGQRRFDDPVTGPERNARGTGRARIQVSSFQGRTRLRCATAVNGHRMRSCSRSVVGVLRFGLHELPVDGRLHLVDRVGPAARGLVRQGEDHQ